MTPQDLALARARTYGFVAEVLLNGWTPRAVGVAQTLAIGDLLPDDPDRRDAELQRVFDRGVPPYESVFRASDGLLGGDIAASVRRAYAHMGFAYTRDDVEPDHLGMQAAALSFLCAAEADARRDGVDPNPIVALQHDFVQQHLGQWVGPVARAASRQGSPVLTELMALLVDLVADTAPVRIEVPTVENPLADASTGLKQVAAYLLVPARCGAWLGSPDIQRVADRAGLACGFGRRQQMMESLWFSAVDHRCVPRLVGALIPEFGDEPGRGDPRRAATRSLLAELATAAGKAGPISAPGS